MTARSKIVTDICAVFYGDDREWMADSDEGGAVEKLVSRHVAAAIAEHEAAMQASARDAGADYAVLSRILGEYAAEEISLGKAVESIRDLCGVVASRLAAKQLRDHAAEHEAKPTRIDTGDEWTTLTLDQAMCHLRMLAAGAGDADLREVSESALRDVLRAAYRIAEHEAGRNGYDCAFAQGVHGGAECGRCFDCVKMENARLYRDRATLVSKLETAERTIASQMREHEAAKVRGEDDERFSAVLEHLDDSTADEEPVRLSGDEWSAVRYAIKRIRSLPDEREMRLLRLKAAVCDGLDGHLCSCDLEAEMRKEGGG